MTLPGIDISNWQATVDWSRIRASGVQFGVVKASEGVGYRDPYLRQNLDGMRNNNVAPGAYQFARPDQADPEQDADFFLDTLDRAGGLWQGEVPVLDLEISANAVGLNTALGVPEGDSIQQAVRQAIREQRFATLLGPTTLHVAPGMTTLPEGPFPRAVGLTPMSTLQWAQRWLTHVMNALHCLPMLYSGRWYMDPHGLTGDPQLAAHGLWLAAYVLNMPPPPPDWTVVAIWQNSDGGIVPGINGPVDTDQFNGDSIDQFRAYGLPSSNPGPTPPQPVPPFPPDPTPPGPDTRPLMDNNQWTYAQRLMLANNTLNPEETAAYLGGFRNG